MKRDSITFYTLWLDAVSALPKEKQGDALLAILTYATKGEIVCEEGSIEMAMLMMAKPQIDINNQRYENGKKGTEFGKLGGRPRKTPTKPQENPKLTPRKPQTNPIGFSTPLSPSSLSPEPPITIPPISPINHHDGNAHALVREDEDYAHSEEDPFGKDLDPKEKSCAKKESPLPDGTIVSITDLADELLSDKEWVSNVARNKEKTEHEVRELVIEFCTGLRLYETSKEIKEAKKHFINWLRKKPKNNERNNQRPARAGQAEPDFSSLAQSVARGIAAAKVTG